MLTNDQYNELWETHFGGNTINNGITNQNCPDFEQYIIRENMLEDYLDLFRGKNTRNQRAIPTANLDYENHPFFDVNDNSVLNEKPCIKYILIAEAAPQVNNNIIKYIYNINIAGGAYITAPLKAFNINNLNNLNTTGRLLELARNGVLIIDLFPFALDYNKIRDHENFNQLCINFFSNLDNYYSLINRIFKFQQQEIIENIDTLNEVNTAIIAPPKTSHAIASFAALNDVDFIGLRIGRNIFEFKENIDTDNIELYINNITFPNNLIGLNRHSYPLINDQNNNIVRVPHYSCNCYNETRGENPRALFIKNALGLP